MYPEIADGIRCGDKWDAGHLQGFDADAEHIYWVFTRRLVKTDLKGNVVKDIAIKKEKNAPKLHGGDFLPDPESPGIFSRSLQRHPVQALFPARGIFCSGWTHGEVPAFFQPR